MWRIHMCIFCSTIVLVYCELNGSIVSLYSYWSSKMTIQLLNMDVSRHMWIRQFTLVMNDSRVYWHIWMSHVAYAWVMSHMTASHMYESCHVCTIHVCIGKFEWVMSHMNESCRIWMSHIYMSHVMYAGFTCVLTHMNESCRICMSHVTYEFFTFVWVMSHINDSRVY